MGHLEYLALTDFRVFPTLQLVCEPGTNVFLGANGEGKTTLLEAIYFLSLLRSFRTSRIEHLFRWQTRAFAVRGRLDTAAGGLDLAVHYGEKRRLRRDGQPVHRASDFIGRCHCISFVAEDIGLVQGAAGQRRRFLDIQLSQLYPAYLADLKDYHHALRSRNALLRRESVDRRAVAAFNGGLASAGGRIMAHRAAYIQRLSHEIEQLAAQLGSPFPFVLRYAPAISISEQPDAASCEERCRESLVAGLERDCRYRHTQTGPHRDDAAVTLDGQPLAQFGSEGQCRLAALLLKIAAARPLAAAHPTRPLVLLVDDVVGELDGHRQEQFFSLLPQSCQLFVACTDSRLAEMLAPATVHHVANGAVSQ
jgi:DNA replication and repair protein RecF